MVEGLDNDIPVCGQVREAIQAPLNWPLMDNNVTREDLDVVIDFLQQEVPILTQSRQVRRFEQEWSEWLGVKHSLFVNSGASANLITITALKELYGIGEIIVPTITWVSDISSVIQCGFTPVFVDIDPKTLGMDTNQVIEKITPATKAIFLTHVLGFNSLNSKLLDHLKEHNILLIEDVCESHGATFNDMKLGTFGLASNFSFYYAHHMTTVEGGIVSTDDDEFYETVRMLRSHGMVRESDNEETKTHYTHNYPDLNPEFIFAMPAYNFRNTEINAVLGRAQLKKLDGNNEQRRENFSTFLNNLDSTKFHTDFNSDGSCNYAFTLVLKNPDDILLGNVIEALKSNEVEARRGTAGGGNHLRQPYLRKLFGDEYENYPNADHIHFYGFYIGNYPGLEKEKILRLCRILNALPDS